MAWIFPTVLGTLALAAGPNLLAQTTEKDSGKWTIQAESQVAQVDGQSNQQNTDESTTLSDPTSDVSQPTANAPVSEPDVAPIIEAPSEKAALELDESSDADEPSLADQVASDSNAEEVGNPLIEGTDQESNPVVDEDVELLAGNDGLWRPKASDTPQTEEAREAARLEKQQRRFNLDQQFQRLQKTMETADGFSLALSEDYFSYGLLLREDGQYDEAIEAFVDALHIQKVNHGIYAPEQRPALKALFETHYALGNVEDFEDYLERILWVESKNPDLKDDFSYKMLVMVGNQYIDQFLRKPIAGQSSVQTLLRAKHHLNAAFKRHRDKPLTVALMPYGELALISFLESQLLDDVDKTASLEDPRLRSSRHIDGRELALASYLANSFPRGTGLLRSYLKKAQTEENLPHVVKALIALGDFNQLFRRHNEAREYYKLAWTQAQNLPEDHKVRAMLTTPVSLPAFQYTIEREPVLPTKPTLLIPLKIDIGLDGKVNEVRRVDESEEIRPYFPRARRMARRTLFRPAMIDGEPQVVTDLDYDQRVYQRR